MVEPKGQIQIDRSTQYSNQIRSVSLVLDGIRVDKIEDGERKFITVSPGPHKLKATIDWCRSREIEFSIGEGETVYFELKSRNPISALYYITFGKNDYLKLNKTDNNNK